MEGDGLERERERTMFGRENGRGRRLEGSRLESILFGVSGVKDCN